MGFGNTAKDGSGTNYWILLSSDGATILAGANLEDAAATGNPMRVATKFIAAPSAVTDGDVVQFQVDALGRLITRDRATPSLQTDTTVNDSDKTFSVPAATEWTIQSIQVNFISTSTAGARQLTIEIQDASSNVIALIKAGVTQIASLTYDYLFAPGVPDITAVRDLTVMTPMPIMTLLPSYVIRIYDSAVIDAAADDMTMRMLIHARSQ